jgi:hypothetical protein
MRITQKKPAVFMLNRIVAAGIPNHGKGKKHLTLRYFAILWALGAPGGSVMQQ